MTYNELRTKVFQRLVIDNKMLKRKIRSIESNKNELYPKLSKIVPRHKTTVFLPNISHHHDTTVPYSTESLLFKNTNTFKRDAFYIPRHATLQ